MELTDEERQIFCEVVDTFEVPEGAYNFRVNGKSVGRKSTKNINVVPKEGGRGLDIYIKKGTKNETVHIPVAISVTGLTPIVSSPYWIRLLVKSSMIKSSIPATYLGWA